MAQCKLTETERSVREEGKMTREVEFLMVIGHAVMCLCIPDDDDQS